MAEYPLTIDITPPQVPEIYRGDLILDITVQEDAAKCLDEFYPLLGSENTPVTGKIFTNYSQMHGQESGSSISIDTTHMNVDVALEFANDHGLTITGFALETPEYRVECDYKVTNHQPGTLLAVYRQN